MGGGGRVKKKERRGRRISRKCARGQLFAVSPLPTAIGTRPRKKNYGSLPFRDTSICGASH